ncbi:MAG: hypothetical protein EXR61_05485 [Chloroflexi bacterium]|nr:hypothetical protein [Chloroflexota bacterium]
MTVTRLLRDDIHIHAPVEEVRALLLPLAEERYRWLPEAFADRRIDEQALSFRLALPLRSESAVLVLGGDDGRAIEFVASGPSVIRALTWVVNAEGPREVHLIAEAVYEPAGGPIGWLLEMALHRSVRRQALRDALWRLKLVVEGRA